MDILSYMKNHVLLLDGGMGTMLARQGLMGSALPEQLNLSYPHEITAIHRAYAEAGSRVLYANTFGANSLHYGHEELTRVIRAGVENARTACRGMPDRFVALDVGPTGRLLAPLGDLDFEDAVGIFARTIRIGAACGVDLVVIETMSDIYEAKAALLAAKENCDLPVFVTCAFGGDGKMMTGASPEAAVALFEGMGADAVGVNCSEGPGGLRETVRRMLAVASVPVIFKPNAGLPDSSGNYDISPNEFAREVAEAVGEGVRIVGGCCGTTPDEIAALAHRLADVKPVPVAEKNLTVVSSGTHTVTFGKEPILIGERINPTGKPRFRAALAAGDMDYILNEGIRQAESGAHILDVNVGIPGIDETCVMAETVKALQAVTDLPLQIDTSSPVAMERALRLYNGKAMVNSVNGKEESMRAVFPLVRKYGGLVVALTLDENGIPSDAEGRVRIAEKILRVAETYGLKKKDMIFDPLAMAASADPGAPTVTLETLTRIREQLGCATVLGVSNISFGLPSRPAVNASFFAMALGRGLSAAILNPHSAEMKQTYFACRALAGQDAGFADYISFASANQTEAVKAVPDNMTLMQAITHGMANRAGELTSTELLRSAPLDIVQNEIIPALGSVGEKFEKGELYLPQLLMAAEAAGHAFEEIRKALPPKKNTSDDFPVVLATVKGDIHDIGKNIVKLLLANYGFPVIDLGKDVSPEAVLEAVLKHHAPLAGLSALMTTTVPAMQETIALLHEKAPFCRVTVGGAVLTQSYADEIGADAYSKDAMGTVRYAQALKEELRVQSK